MIKKLKFTMMKRKIIQLMSGALMLAATVVLGSNDSNVKIEVIGEREFRIQVQNIAGEASIVLQEENGEVLYRETVTSASYEKRFDLTLLKKGNYVLRVEDNFKIQSTRISLSDAVLAEFEELYFLPVITQKESLISISKIAIKNEKLVVRIYDQEGVLLYNDTLHGKEFRMGRGYDFSKVPKGVYNIFLASNGHSINRRIDLR
jgi:cell division protein YceG involved in septum cleavage